MTMTENDVTMKTIRGVRALEGDRGDFTREHVDLSP